MDTCKVTPNILIWSCVKNRVTREECLLGFCRIFDRHGIALLCSFFLGSLWLADPSRAVMARLLDIVIRRHAGGYYIRAFAPPLRPAQHDFRVTFVVLDRSLNFYLPPLKLANVAHLFDVGREDDGREGARSRLFAENQECCAIAAALHVQHRAADALSGSHVDAGVGEGNAVGG